MKCIFALFMLIFLTCPDAGMCYRVKIAEKCKSHREESQEIIGIIGNVIIGERAFMTLTPENGDELIMLPENDKALGLFRENRGLQMRISYHKEWVVWVDDYSGNVPGDCESAYIFESGELMK